MKGLAIAYLLAAYCILQASCMNWDDYRKQMEDMKEKLAVKREEFITYKQSLKPSLVKKLMVKRNEWYKTAVSELNDINAEVLVNIEALAYPAVSHCPNICMYYYTNTSQREIQEAKDDELEVYHCVSAYEEEYKKCLEILGPKLDECLSEQAGLIDQLVPRVDELIAVCDELISRLGTAFKDCASTNEEKMLECVMEEIGMANLMYYKVFPSLHENNRALERSFTETAMSKIEYCNRSAIANIYNDAVANKESIQQCIWDARPGLPSLENINAGQ